MSATLFYELMESALKSYVFDKLTASSREEVTEKYKLNYNPLQVSTVGDIPQKIEVPHEVYLCSLICNECFKPVASRELVFDNHYFYDQNRSNERVAVYLNTFINNTAIVGIRGTDITNPDDIRADMGIVLGEANPQLMSIVRKTIAIINSLVESGFEPDNITITGFSLGGDVALYAGTTTFLSSKIITFNAGSSPLQRDEMFRNPMAVNYVVKGDVISQNIAQISPTNTIELDIPTGSLLEAHRLTTIINHTHSDYVIQKRERGRFKTIHADF